MKDETRRADRSPEAVTDETGRRPSCFDAVSMGEVIGDHDLDKALALAARLEDQEIVRKLQRR
ncbi:MAG: hypothetical protein OXM56_05715 [Gammaproteobacteria bacterium]|nr:hypothetical protein [Gammaproteobacteria bacterium]